MNKAEDLKPAENAELELEKNKKEIFVEDEELPETI